ncbi:MAG: hypothetical protein JXA91_07865 [Candidatus Thermoplasmatota archaeon]|nr:hypothetical protein [Candidatus Thermoplasmatota archaeon]
MKANSTYKVPQGKLLKISLEYNENKELIDKISIMGDFFAYPEESIELLEKELKNVSLNENILSKKIQSIIQKYDIQFIGLDCEGLVKGIMMCLK